MRPDCVPCFAAAVVLLLGCLPARPSEVRTSLQERFDGLEAGGSLHLEAGDWQGPLRVDKPCVLTGDSNTVIRGNEQDHVIHITADNVELKGLIVSGSGLDLSKDHAGILIEGTNCIVRNTTISNSLHGIYLKEASHCLLEGNRIIGKTNRIVPIADVMQEGLQPVAPGLCSVRFDINRRGNGIHLWNSSDNVLRNNEIERTRDGVYFSFSHRNQIEGNHIHHLRYGLHYMYSDDNDFHGNRFHDNAAGAALMYSEGIQVRDNQFVNNSGHRAYGLLMQSVDFTGVTGNTIRNNTVGLYLENSNGNTFKNNALTGSYIGIRMTNSSRENEFTRNRFQRNLHSVEMSAGIHYNQWSVNGVGNDWGDGAALDLNGDGIGELPHRETDLLGRHRGRFPSIALLSRSPVLDLIRFVQSRAQLPGIPAIVDPDPIASDSERALP